MALSSIDPPPRSSDTFTSIWKDWLHYLWRFVKDKAAILTDHVGDTAWNAHGDTATGNVDIVGDLDVDGDLAVTGVLGVTGSATLGGLRLSDTSWDDLRFPATGSRLDSASTRYSFDLTDLGVTFDSDSRYTNEQLSFIAQLPHRWKEGTSVDMHLHWIQNQAAVPNWLMAYRVYNNGEAPGSFTLLPWSHSIVTYTSGTICQITDFAEISMTGKTLSCIIDIKLWRDTTNASTEFSGADPVATDVLLKELDIHYEIDSLGSNTEYTKGT